MPCNPWKVCCCWHGDELKSHNSSVISGRNTLKRGKNSSMKCLGERWIKHNNENGQNSKEGKRICPLPNSEEQNSANSHPEGRRGAPDKRRTCGRAGWRSYRTLSSHEWGQRGPLLANHGILFPTLAQSSLRTNFVSRRWGPEMNCSLNRWNHA